MTSSFYSGQILNNFTVLGLYTSGKQGKHKRWYIKCNLCNKVFDKASNEIKRQISCGCHRSIDIDTPLDTLFKLLIVRHNKFEGNLISIQEFEILSTSNCFYCKAEPSNDIKGFKYSGIDRVDSLFGYISSNVRACCWICNRMKNDLTELEFYAHVKKIYEAGKPYV